MSVGVTPGCTVTAHHPNNPNTNSA